MNSRERVLRTIRFERPDRIPLSYAVIAAALLEHGEPLIELCRRHPNDFYDAATLTVPERDAGHYRPDGTYFKRTTDAWGAVWEARQEGMSGEVKQSPIQEWSQLDTYRLPPVPHADAAGRAQLKRQVEQQKQDYVGWGGGGSLFERMQVLRGVENLMLDIAEDREEVYRLADRLVDEYLIPLTEISLDAGVDVAGFGDDWGTQQALLISPLAWRRIFKPRYKRMFDLVHDAGALVWLHSDGMILDLVDDLIEIGVDVLNPQIHTMDRQRLRALTHGRCCLAPDLDRQHCMPFGSPAEVQAHIAAIRDTFADASGGLILYAPIEKGLPLANIAAALNAFHQLRDLG